MGMGLPARLFYIALRISPPNIRSRMWKSLYQRMARSHKDPDFKFMNYGFKDNYPPALSTEDEPDRIFIQLYHMNIRDTELEGKDILEIVIVDKVSNFTTKADSEFCSMGSLNDLLLRILS